MSNITITIDGKAAAVAAGTTILAAAEQAGIEIPTLCTVQGKQSDSPCGLCVVELEGVPELVRACATEAQDGMQVATRSSRVMEYRKERLAAFCSTHFGDCRAPCNLTCPAGINVQGYIAHVARGEYEEAVRLVMEKNPLPFSVGRVCPRFCETRCRRLLVDEPVSINHLKRFVADWCMEHKANLRLPKEPATGKRIAVIGGGPAGLSAAFYLARLGHGVTIFEALPKLGGMLRYGIPEYRIPKKVLDYEIQTILRMGVEVKANLTWGTDYSLQDLREQNFDAIFLGVGAWQTQGLAIPGAELPGVFSATCFLMSVAVGARMSLGRRTAVLGGNNVAMEAARSLLRMGVQEVTVVYPRARLEMPANQRGIAEAEREGVQFLLMAESSGIYQEPDGLRLELTRMKLGEPDEKGVRQLEPIVGSKLNLRVDTVISSLGQTACDTQIAGTLEQQLELTPKGTIKANPRTSLTSVPGVFAAGDAVSGPRSVIQAVVGARRAAENIHRHVMGLEKESAESRFNITRGRGFDEVDFKNFEGISIKLREKMPERPPEIRTQDFDEARLGFTETMARTEASRCLACGCNAVDHCELRSFAIEYGVDPTKSGMGKSPVYAIDHSHPTLAVDLNKCVFCQRCRNSCEYNALQITAMVDERRRPSNLSLSFNENCVACGKCADKCSTGALTKKDITVPIVCEETRDVRTTCPYCGCGCAMVLRVKGNTIMEAFADPDQSPNFGALCVKGRFGHKFVGSRDRLTVPLIRKEGHLVESTWDEALKLAAARFRDLKSMFGQDAIAGFSSARCTNEENFLMQKFMRAVVGTNNIDHCARL